jgi:hypothetical protein
MFLRFRACRPGASTSKIANLFFREHFGDSGNAKEVIMIGAIAGNMTGSH